jgi:hypothetical protein
MAIKALTIQDVLELTQEVKPILELSQNIDQQNVSGSTLDIVLNNLEKAIPVLSTLSNKSLSEEQIKALSMVELVELIDEILEANGVEQLLGLFNQNQSKVSEQEVDPHSPSLMMIVLEFFAHNYSYSKQETMQLTIPEALFFYTQTIKREKLKALDQVTEWEIQLAIATNPHLKSTDSKKLSNEFKRVKMRMQDTKVKPQEVEKNLDHLKRLLGNK